MNPGGIRLGLRANWAQFTLLVVINALVGGMLGQERTVLPLLAEEEFGLTDVTAALTFIVAFGLVKAGTNWWAGTLSDRFGRKPVLVVGWIIAIPIPLILIWAPSWGWVNGLQSTKTFPSISVSFHLSRSRAVAFPSPS